MSCKSQEIPRKDWSKYLLQSVKEKARVAMSYIDIEHSDYDEVKRQMLSYFVKTPDYYRNRFHKVQLDSSKEPAAFVKDVQHYLITWLELSNIDLKDPKQIIDMMVYDKVLQMASEDLFSYLKEKQIHSIDKLISALNSYKDSHPGAVVYKSSNSNNFSTYHNRSGGNVQSNVSNFRRYSYSPNFHNSRRHSDSPPKRNEREQKSQRRKVLPCFYCNRTNHIARECFYRTNFQSKDFPPQTFKRFSRGSYRNGNSDRGKRNSDRGRNSNIKKTNKVKKNKALLV